MRSGPGGGRTCVYNLVMVFCCGLKDGININIVIIFVIVRDGQMETPLISKVIVVVVVIL